VRIGDVKALLLLLALLVPGAAFANDVALTNQVFVERVVTEADGTRKTVLAEPEVVTPGERLLFTIHYKNNGTKPAADFVVTNPVPTEVVYAGGEADGSLLSVDGGKTWGPLDALKVTGPDGSTRPAQAPDVTHIRWAFDQPVAAGAEGKLSFRAQVK
jgi:uncharacterized repeat protein (TIGR01451 family)